MHRTKTEVKIPWLLSRTPRPMLSAGIVESDRDGGMSRRDPTVPADSAPWIPGTGIAAPVATDPPGPDRRRKAGKPVKLTFLGTRGEIEARTRRHRMHTSLLVEYRGGRVMIDAGEDWREAIHGIRPRPHGVVITHAHPDHAWGLKDGSPAEVWATAVAWKAMDAYTIPGEDRREVQPRVPFTIRGITFEAFPVEHSIRAPAVGYRITAGRVTVWYAPDLVYIADRESALVDCRLYIGDGATLTQSFVRRRGDALIGHAPVRTQLTWCRKEGVPAAIITHCGKEIVEGDERVVEAELRGMAEERDVAVDLAYDGMERVLR